METGQKVFLLVFLSVGVLFIYVVFIHPSQDDSDKVNSDFQQSDLGNGTGQPEEPVLSQQNVTAGTDRGQNLSGKLNDVPYKVVLPGRRTQDPNIPRQQPKDQNKNAGGTLEEDAQQNDQNSPLVVRTEGDIPIGQSNIPRGEGFIPQREGNIPEKSTLPQGAGGERAQFIPQPVPNQNRNEDNDEEDEDKGNE